MRIFCNAKYITISASAFSVYDFGLYIYIFKNIAVSEDF